MALRLQSLAGVGRDGGLSRQTRHDWAQSIGRRYRRATTKRTAVEPSPHRRRLRFEPLEDRRMLSITATTSPTSSMQRRRDVATRGDLCCEYRPRPWTLLIFLTCADSQRPGKDPAYAGRIGDHRSTHDQRTGANLLTIDAQQNSRNVDITATTGDFTISGLTLTGGMVTADGNYFGDPTAGGGLLIVLRPTDF